jgi:Protein of unknown function (DUF2924)
MSLSLQDLAGFERSTLIDTWKVKLGSPPPPNTSQDMMRLIVGWEIQTKTARGDVRELKSALRLFGKFGSSGETETIIVKRKAALSPGTRLSREWQGRTYNVDVLDKGFAYDGKLFTSLTPIAKAITKSHRSGPLFFGVSK